MLTKHVIAVDMDGVLTDLMGFTQTAANAAGVDCDFANQTTHDFIFAPDFSQDAKRFLLDLWGRKSTWTDLPPTAILEPVRQLYEIGYDVVIVTSPWSNAGSVANSVEGETAWLAKHGLGGVPVLFTKRVPRVPAPTMKLPPPKHYVRADIFIDDHPEICEALVQAGTRSKRAPNVWMPERPWNEPVPGTWRVSEAAIAAELVALKEHVLGLAVL
jgi:5'(3')-deoxyribonucleotidase